MSGEVWLGLMSGTSLDGVDAVVARFDPFVVLGRASRPMPEDLRERLLALQASGPDELHRAALAARDLADLYAETGRAAAAAAGRPVGAIAAAGAHGATVRHRPELGFTLQLLDAARLAERLGCAVVSDLRSADVAAAGQGAPLLPAFHAAVLGAPDRRRAIVNLGGFANVTLLPAAGGADPRGEPVRGWDTGPANVLMDAWCAARTGQPFDADGAWASQGRPVPRLLDRCLAEPWFALPPPKSTGRDLFGLPWLQRQLDALAAAPPSDVDVQATLLELTVATVAGAVQDARVDEVFLCGGGAHNAALRRGLASRLAPVPVATTDALGLPPTDVEAAGFAWFAMRRLAGLPANLPSVTGALGPRVLGAVHAAPGAARPGNT